MSTSVEQVEEHIGKGEVKMLYKNYKGITETRTIRVLDTFWGHTSYHPEEQWFMEAWCYDRGEKRNFAIKDIIQWNV